jgi:predicted nucleic acid-binding protein
LPIQAPINYLILIGHVAVPSVVRDELTRPKAPLSVRQWIADPPIWLEVRAPGSTNDIALADLDAGEKAAIGLAMEVQADLLLMDERRGVRIARNKGFRVAGTLAILNMAARRDLLSLADAFDRLKRTTFHYRQEIMDQFLAEQNRKA